MRKLLAFVVVLVAVLAVLDRVALVVTQRVVASRMQDSGGLATTPKVHIKGFPFLTQAIGGTYDRVDVDAGSITRNNVTVSSLSVQVTDAEIPLSAALHGKVDAVPVQSLKASAVVTYVELATDSKIADLKITPKGRQVVLTGTITIPYVNQRFTGRATSTVTLSGSSLRIRATSIAVLGAHSSLIDKYLAGLLDFDVKVPALPYGLRLTGATPEPTGVVLTAASGPTVLRAQ